MHHKIFNILLLCFIVLNCSKTQEETLQPSQEFDTQISVDDDYYFEKNIYQIVDNVYVAIGYGLANSILIVGDGGNIIIDVTESDILAAEIRERFEEISDQPIEAIFYTHSHVDHWRGAFPFVDDDTEVYAHETFKKGFYDQNNLLKPILTERGMKQFGFFLPKELQRGHGLGFTLDFDFKQPPVVYPTVLLEGKKNILTIAGVTLEIVHSPGETDDQIIIYYEDKEIVFSGDNYYMRFPNLYTIRGTSYRDTYKWYKSVDEMRAYNPTYLVSSHGPYLSNKQEVQDRLTIYRDAIQYVHDYAIRGANKGKTPDELVDEFIYPQFFKENFDLREQYGKVSWSIRNVYNGYLGFFDGKAVNLEPLSTKERSKKLFKIIGSRANLISLISEAIKNGEFQWAAELSQLGVINFPNDNEIKNLYAQSLEELSNEETNPIARNYYLSEAYEIKGKITPDLTFKLSEEQIRQIPIETIFEAMPPRLNPDKANNKLIAVGFNMSDTEKQFGIIIRNNIAEIIDYIPENAEIIVTVETSTWKGLVMGITDAKSAITSGKLSVSGNYLKFIQFSTMFDKD
ncbi:MAG TPA: MBL fold metallo-hydrolase [Candidatus Marinimicrobia bacterium]|jgi:alkyl sulfatase BDS1-like metallo-beta-lactamase superfamily hydrolase|nr:MBL fold metallo-hydrolase [Candidatus Neomarinimicrobiota bacterium]HIL86416.1 MBL fold metallo-hydrolase [Candidatus Neomarinimicrobiota bacterium]